MMMIISTFQNINEIAQFLINGNGPPQSRFPRPSLGHVAHAAESCAWRNTSTALATCSLAHASKSSHAGSPISGSTSI